MTTRSDFDDIRPYNDSELTTVLERMVSDKEVLAGIAMVMPKQLADKLVLGYKELRSVDQFQEEYSPHSSCRTIETLSSTPLSCNTYC